MRTTSLLSKIHKGLAGTCVAALAALVLAGAAGCGSGGYPGGGITSLSASTATLDATQSFSVTARLSGNLPIAWALTGPSCTGSSCGTLSATSGTTVTYTAPAGITAPMQATLAATIAGTKSSESVAITVNPDPTLTGTPPAGVVGTAYTATLKASGGTAPLTMSQTNGSLPPGLTFDASTGVISGTPTTAGVYAFTIQVTDAATTPYVLTVPEIINVTNGAAPGSLSLTTSTLPGGTVGVPYTATVGVTGGTAPYACTVTSGTLPAGLSMGAGCVVSGTPTKAGTVVVTVKATDSSNPVLSTTGPESITIAPAPLQLTSGTLPDGTVNVPYTATIGVTGGTSPYSCAVTSGTLPAGLNMQAGCVVAGTPTTAGTTTVTVKATDSSNPALSTTGPETITINASSASLTLSSLPNGTVDVPYSSTITTTGGKAPYTCVITGLPAGLTANGCTVTGTPTTAGTSTVTVKSTDSTTPTALTVTQTQTVVIAPAALKLTMTTLPDGTVNVPYTATIGITGGTTPYSCTVTSGTLPAGLNMGANCTVSGTPTAAGTTTVTVAVKDAGNPAQTTSGPETITINPAPTLTLNTLPNGTVGTPYSGTITPTGGTSPYTCTITGLPAGLTANNCAVTGTPTTAGTSKVNVSVTDSGHPAITTTTTDTIVIAASGTLALTGSLPDATQNKAYSQSLTATGGTPPYTYSITAGSLPPGINLSNGTDTPASAVFSGTPTTVGASSFTLTVADSKGNTASLPLILMVDYPTGPNDGELKGPYAYLFQGYDDGLLGVLTYQTATVGSFTADGQGGINLGELDSNHQTTTSTTTTVPTSSFIGTYYVGADNRGMITITLLTTDKTTGITTTGKSTTYAISLAAPVSPSTISTEGDLIEYDDDQLAGTRGSGTLLAQTPADITAGLKGSYAFGFIGDTPCLLSCAANLGAGPVASVGQFATSTSGSTLLGMTDTAVAATYTPYQSAELSGSFGAPDANGRVQLTLDNASNPNGEYPTDYAAYIVNKSEMFVMSTDKHSTYILQAGTAQLQTTPGAFSSASMNAGAAGSSATGIIGYENALPNPGLVGGTLSSVLNLSSASIFRLICDGTSTCDTTNVDNAGLTNLVDSLTGPVLGLSKVQLLSTLLGAYTSTGNSSFGPITSDGRGVLAYPAPPCGLLGCLLNGLLGGLLGANGTPAPRVFYLVGPNQGYFLETGYAALGQFEPQTGAPFSLGTLNGTYVDGTTPAATVASINASGYFTADGKGNVTDQTLDMNVGVGTLNVLQLGTTGGATTYKLDDTTTNDPATTGRYLLGDGLTVLYAISPNKFVLLNTNTLQTAPSVSFLYK